MKYFGFLLHKFFDNLLTWFSGHLFRIAKQRFIAPLRSNRQVTLVRTKQRFVMTRVQLAKQILQRRSTTSRYLLRPQRRAKNDEAQKFTTSFFVSIFSCINPIIMYSNYIYLNTQIVLVIFTKYSRLFVFLYSSVNPPWSIFLLFFEMYDFKTQ